MKGKITIVLLSLALVFGMIAASCDNGAYPTFDEKDPITQFAYDGTATNDGLPAFDGDTPKEPIKGERLFKILEIEVNYPISGNDNNRVKAYLLNKVVADPAETDPAKKAKKEKFAGLPLIIKNPVVSVPAISALTNNDLPGDFADGFYKP